MMHNFIDIAFTGRNILPPLYAVSKNRTMMKS